MEFGVFGINTGVLGAEPSAAIELAQVAERSGWESVWTGEHLVLPDPPTADSPAPPRTPLADVWVTLAAIAATTERIRVGTGVVVVPYHHPVALAKQAASLDRLSAGRFILGIGVGYLASEFAALGVPLAERAARTDDAIAVVRALWSGATETAPFLGRPIVGVRSEPRPATVGGPPLVVGGHGEAAFRRAAAIGDGYYGWQLDPPAAEAAIARIDELRRATDGGRDRDRAFECSITPPRGVVLDAALVAAYQAVGVDRLIVQPPDLGDVAAVGRFVETALEDLVP